MLHGVDAGRDWLTGRHPPSKSQDTKPEESRRNRARKDFLIFPPSRPIFPVICLVVCRVFVVWTQATDGSAVDGHAVTPTRSSSPPSAGHASMFLGNSTGPRLAQSSQLPHVQSSFSPAGHPRCWVAGFKASSTSECPHLQLYRRERKPNAIGAPSPHLAHMSIIHDFPSCCPSI